MLASKTFGRLSTSMMMVPNMLGRPHTNNVKYSSRMVTVPSPVVALNAAKHTSSHHGPITPKKRQSHEEVEHYLSNLFNLEGKTAYVTGAAGSVGKLVALSLAKSGADVVISDIPQKLSECQDIVEKITALGREALAVSCDVRDQASVNAAMAAADKRFGKLDILVHSSGVLGDMMAPQDMTEDNWQNVFATNVDGVFHTAKAAYPLLKKGGHAKVTIMCSIAALYGYGMQSAYCASKGAVLPLAKSLALAWAKDGINVNCVLPGPANTAFTAKVLTTKNKVDYILDRIPQGRLAEPEDFVGPILFLSSHASDYITGTHITVDGGGTARAMAQ